MNFNRKYILVDGNGKKIAWSNDINELSKHSKLLNREYKIITNPKYDKKRNLNNDREDIRANK